MKTTGSCYCGALEYVAEVDEGRVGICHCRDCQKFSGSAFRMAAVVAPGSFHFTKGTPTYFDKTADSGNVRRMAFCGTCGTHIAATPEDPHAEGAYVSLRVATSNDFRKMKPAGELWCSSRLPWMKHIDGTIEFDRQP